MAGNAHNKPVNSDCKERLCYHSLCFYATSYEQRYLNGSIISTSSGKSKMNVLSGISGLM